MSVKIVLNLRRASAVAHVYIGRRAHLPRPFEMMEIKTNVKQRHFLRPTFCGVENNRYLCTRFNAEMGKSHTAGSLRILQDGNVAKVVGCSGAI